MRPPSLPVRPGVAWLPLLRRGLARVNVLMFATVSAKWGTDKFQCHGNSVVRFGSGAAAAARPWRRPAAAVSAGSGPARGNPERSAAGRRAAAQLPGTGPGAGHLPRPGAGVLQPVAVRGLPDQPD